MGPQFVSKLTIMQIEAFKLTCYSHAIDLKSRNMINKNVDGGWRVLYTEDRLFIILSLQPDLMGSSILKIKEISIKSPSFHPVFGPAVTPYSLFQWCSQSKEILLNLSMKCWNSGFNTQGLRIIIVVVQVGAVKIYAAVVEALRKKERQDETQFTTKIGEKTSLGPSYFTL